VILFCQKIKYFFVYYSGAKLLCVIVAQENGRSKRVYMFNIKLPQPCNNPSHFVSWSGGKDSCLALFRTIKKYGKPKYLLNMLTEDGYRSRSHGLSKTVLEKQAYLLQIPINFYATTWGDYESVFIDALHDLKKEGIEMGVFGDIKIPDQPDWIAHRQWADHVCNKASITAYEPLWDDSVQILLQDFFDAGFVAKIISVNAELLSANYLGKILDKELITEFTKLGIDPAGEKGEYHTIVIDGPIFTKPLCLLEKERVLKEGYWFLDVC
jgi:diphthine-ammonia ligase